MGHADDLLSSHDSFSYCDFARVRCDTVAKHVAAVEGFFQVSLVWEAWRICSCHLPLLAGIPIDTFHTRAHQGNTHNMLHNTSQGICAVCTHAEVVCMSCQLLLKFCFSSFIRLMPSFCLISTRCFSLAANTCRKVEISSSSWEKKRGRRKERNVSLFSQQNKHRLC